MGKNVPSVGAVLSSAWDFYRKQPVLNRIALWMLALPSFLLATLEKVMPQEGGGLPPYAPYLSLTDSYQLLFAYALIFLLSILMFWGYATVLFVGRRMIVNRAGRVRTSFKAVRREALPLIVPLFLTGILRDCMTILWSLLYVIPVGFLLLGTRACSLPTLSMLMTRQGWQNCAAVWLLLPLLLPAIVYRVRTFFYDIALVADDLRYRPALHRSADAVENHLGRSIGILLVTTITFVVPTIAIAAIFTEFMGAFDIRLMLLGDILGSIVVAVGSVLFMLSSIALYGALRKKSPNYIEA